MAKITGIGGVFLKSKGDGAALAAWYKEHLGMADIEPTIANKQMLAAVGQGQLVREWENLFKIYNYSLDI